VVFVPICPPTVPVAPPNYSILPAPTVQVEPAAPAKSEPPKADPAPAAPRPVAPGVPPGNATADPGGAVKPAEFARPEAASPPKSGTPKLELPQVPLPGTADPSRDDVKIPPLIPRLTNPDVPPLTLPKVPVGPAAGGDTSTSKASPLTAAPRVDVYPVDGPPPAGPKAKRTVGFFNHTDRDLRLTVEEETVTLPRRHYVTAEVPAAFTWKLDGDERRTEVPAMAPGVEVVIRR
jgi:hypothetical protein